MAWARMLLMRAAVAKIFAAKERPAWDPVIAHVSDREMVESGGGGS